VTFSLRDFQPSDAEAVNQIALAAFDEYKQLYADWPTLAANLSRTASLADQSELIVASKAATVVGAVAYVAPGRPRQNFFPSEWPIVRMLVVLPSERGQGIGRALTEECIRRAGRDGAPLLALHTSPIMRVALPMYQRLGFERHSDAPSLMGVPYGIYVKQLNPSARV
jgi:predicted N-acetyltransferase YhbS